MSKNPGQTVIRNGDEVLFRLRDGQRPLVYPDTTARVSYDMGVNVLHIGTVKRIGTLDGIEACALNDGTIVAIADIDPDSMIVNPSAACGALPAKTPDA